MNKKVLVILLIGFIFVGRVNALECIHINSNGVEMICEKYEELKEYYDENLLEYFTQEEWDKIKDSDVANIRRYYVDDIVLDRAYVQTNYKRLELVENNGFVTVSLIWLQNPAVRSHDVFAVRFVGGVVVYGSTVFRQMYMQGGNLIVNTTATKKTLSNGFGYSFKLSNYSSLQSYITFSKLGTGSIYSSYQHAKTTTSLANSMLYTLSYSGYGHTILFDSSVASNYDNMSGVSISV